MIVSCRVHFLLFVVKNELRWYRDTLVVLIVDEACFVLYGVRMSDAKEFFKESEPLFQFYREGKYEDALVVAEKLTAEFPTYAARTYFWQICLLAMAGRQEWALHVFEEALSNGIWWSEGQLRSDSDLASLQNAPEFEHLVAISKEKHRQAQAASTPDLFVHVPNGKGPFSLLMALHARGSSPDLDVHFWKSAVKFGWMLAMPQSSQMASPLAYLWDDREKSFSELAEHVHVLVEKYPIDVNRIVIAGFSQGAARAMQVVMNGLVNVRGFFAVVPGMIEGDELNSWSNSTGTWNVLVSGGRDSRHDFFQQVKESFEKKRIPLMFKNYPEMAHDFPNDFDDVLQQGLNFILNEEQE